MSFLLALENDKNNDKEHYRKSYIHILL